MRKIYPPTYFIIYLLLSIVLHFVMPVAQLISPPLNYSGIVLILLGIILNIWADQLYKKNQTEISPDKKPKVFVKNGPYHYSRNPMYLGIIMILGGASVILGSIISFIGPILFYITIELKFIGIEEKNMNEVFGKEFEEYKQTVRKWI